MTSQGVITPIFNNLRYQASNSFELSLNQEEDMLFIQTRVGEITVLDKLDEKQPRVLTVIRRVPGGEVVDICLFGKELMLCMTKHGVLSCIAFGNQFSEVLCMQPLDLSENEILSSMCPIEGDKINPSVIIVSSKVEKNYNSPEMSQNIGNKAEISFNALTFDLGLTQFNALSPRTLSLEFMMSDYCLFTKCVQLEKSTFAVLMIKNESTILVLDFNDKNFTKISEKNFKKKIKDFVVSFEKLWVIEEEGVVRILSS